jgi:glucokinase
MTKDKSESVVLGDIGGTNARFAVLQDGVLSDVEHMKVSEYRQFADALDAFLKRRSAGRSIHHAIFGVAGMIERDRCALTNNPWIVGADELRARFEFSTIHIVNDFEALAWSLPHLTTKDLRLIGGQKPNTAAPMVVVGPGTGLGVAAFIQGERGDLVIRSEGGHATLPSASSREDAIIANLRAQFGHVSAERVLSGPGLENLYRVVASLDSQTVPQCTAAEITKAALTNRCAVSRAALDTFCGLLGGVAGNLALSFGAQGGVYIAGGIASQLREYLPQSQFRSRFEAKGRLTSYLKAIPTYLVLHDDPAFVGLQFLAGQET